MRLKRHGFWIERRCSTSRVMVSSIRLRASFASSSLKPPSSKKNSHPHTGISRGPVRPDRLPAVDDLANTVGRELALVARGDAREVGSSDVQERRDRPVALASRSMATGAEAPVDLDPGIAREFGGVRGGRNGRDEEHDEPSGPLRNVHALSPRGWAHPSVKIRPPRANTHMPQAASGICRPISVMHGMGR